MMTVMLFRLQVMILRYLLAVRVEGGVCVCEEWISDERASAAATDADYSEGREKAE